jgi:hypothetical protein
MMDAISYSNLFTTYSVCSGNVSDDKNASANAHRSTLVDCFQCIFCESKALNSIHLSTSFRIIPSGPNVYCPKTAQREMKNAILFQTYPNCQAAARNRFHIQQLILPMFIFPPTRPRDHHYICGLSSSFSLLLSPSLSSSLFLFLSLSLFPPLSLPTYLSFSLSCGHLRTLISPFPPPSPRASHFPGKQTILLLEIAARIGQEELVSCSSDYSTRWLPIK